MKQSIRFGLTAIKGLGEDTVDTIIAERNRGGNFVSLQDFAKRVPAKLMNKKTLEALAFSGSFDEFGDRGAIVDSLEELCRFAKDFQEKKEAGQMGLFGGVDDSAIAFSIKNTVATKEDILSWERESLGLFVSDHPLKGLKGYFEKYGKLIGTLTKEEDAGQKRTLHGMVNSVRKIVTKSGKNMAILELEDTSGKIECAVFPKIYDRVPAKALETDAFVRIRGKVDERNEELNCIVDEVKLGNLSDVQNSAQMFAEPSEDAGKEVDFFAITIPQGTTREKVDQIKQMLITAKKEGAKKVIIAIDGKEIELPFTINVTSVLENDIANVLG